MQKKIMRDCSAHGNAAEESAIAEVGGDVCGWIGVKICAIARAESACKSAASTEQRPPDLPPHRQFEASLTAQLLRKKSPEIPTSGLFSVCREFSALPRGFSTFTRQLAERSLPTLYRLSEAFRFPRFSRGSRRAVSLRPRLPLRELSR